jgi:hypothetical protein
MKLNRREKMLLIAAGSVVLLWLGSSKLHAWFLAPVEERQFELDRVNGEIALKLKNQKAVQAAMLRVKQWRERSLSPNPLDAQRHYQQWLTDQANLVGFEGLQVTPGRTTSKGSAYTAVTVTLQGRAKLSRVSEFLYHFYRADLPQRIVSFNVVSPAMEGDPTLQVMLTAEALAIQGAKHRAQLFPVTTLSEDFSSRSSAQEIVVEDASVMPEETPLRVRIGNEFLQVIQRDGDRWTVRGGADATSPQRHSAGEEIEQAPIWAAYADITLEDFRSLVGNSPFVKPAPPPRPPRREVPVRRETPPPRDNFAREVYLAAAIMSNEEPTAWLYRRSNNQRTVVQKKSQLSFGDWKAVVLDIQPDYVVFEHQDASWKLRLGDSLNAMQRLTPDAGPADDEADPTMPPPSGEDAADERATEEDSTECVSESTQSDEADTDSDTETADAADEEPAAEVDPDDAASDDSTSDEAPSGEATSDESATEVNPAEGPPSKSADPESAHH